MTCGLCGCGYNQLPSELARCERCQAAICSACLGESEDSRLCAPCVGILAKAFADALRVAA